MGITHTVLLYLCIIHYVRGSAESIYNVFTVVLSVSVISEQEFWSIGCAPFFAIAPQVYTNTQSCIYSASSLIRTPVATGLKNVFG